jgi:predicted AAA+ superfamily ATPase
MKRQPIEKMKEWLGSSVRKPLILRGARQVGKTWLVRALAADSGMQLTEVNFEKRPDFEVHFKSNDPKTILLNLESIFNQKIIPGKAILFLDEIQAAPELIAKLRWFYEEMPELAVIAAGSLLEFVLEKHTFSMPVGRINYFYVEPMGFEEFLLAKNEIHLLEAIKNTTVKNPFNEGIHNKANQLFREFVMVGGMPEAVSTWINTHSLGSLSAVQQNLIQTYQDDFAKYTGRLSIHSLDDVLRAVPAQLAQKFMYAKVNSTSNHASIKSAVDLLSKSRLCHKIYGTAGNGIPIGAELNEKIFKMILIDVGLVSSMLDLRLHQFETIQDILLINKGALAEQVAGQLLRLLSPYYIDPKLFYWSRESKGSSAEIDYLIQSNAELIPIEVKAGGEGKLRSLHQFMHEKRWKKAIRIYSGPLQQSKINIKTPQGYPVAYELLSLPFYLISEVHRLL